MRKPLASFGLTAARYDMLYAIFGGVPQGGPLWVPDEPKRATAQSGRAQVELTDAGRARLRETAQCLARASRRLLCTAICFGGAKDPKKRLWHLCAYESYLDAMRMHYGDKAWLTYRWHPDD
jgi:hypothetical protein